MEIDILIDAPDWDARDLEGWAQAACITTLRYLFLDPGAHSLSILACDDARIATLNGDFRDKPTPTNVLSWPAEDRAPDRPGTMPDLIDVPEELGDLALAFQTCAREARDGGKPLDHHVAHLIVHGLLHCLGFDHETDRDAKLMEGTETLVLARLGIPDPY